MNLTPEQQKAVTHIKATDGLTLISAIAGSGKTTLLTAIADSVPHTNALYLAYNKSIATSSKKKFPTTTHCLTTHSLAYQAIVKPNNLKVGSFRYKNVSGKLSYLEKCDIVESLREFCLSAHTDVSEFCKEQKVTKYESHIKKHLKEMSEGKIEVSHDFYLKLFHIRLANKEIEYDEDFDFIMLDEAGDINPVTLEIFKLLPTKKRIAVGDPFQNIYSFNHTINCFEVLADEGTLFPLSETFRVPQEIAGRVQTFCQKYMNPDMQFRSTQQPDDTIKTRAFISRTNSALIDRMILLNQEQTPYSLVRRASDIFKIPLMLANMKYQSFVSNPEYSHLQKDFNEWYENNDIKTRFKSPYSYIASLYDDDVQLKQATRIILKHGKAVLFSTYYEAKSHESTNQPYSLTTAHSAKGLEFDEVSISDDLNDSITPIVELIRSDPSAIVLPEQKEALNLYYVAVTRCTKRLNNAVHLR